MDSVERRDRAKVSSPAEGGSSTDLLKEHDSIVAVLFASRAAMALLPVAKRTGVTPNQLTAASCVLSLGAAACIASGTLGVAVALLIVVGFVLDCLDGTLARATGRASDFGRWLDSIADLVKVYALIVALAVAASVDGGRLPLAGATVALLGYLLCELHVQIARQLPQRSTLEYAAHGAPWGGRLRAFGQRIDLAFAIGEVLLTVALSVALRRPDVGLAVLALATPVQFVSYSVRFWRHRYVRSQVP